MRVQEFQLYMAELFEREFRLNRIASHLAANRHWSVEAQDFYFDQTWQAEAFGLVVAVLEWTRAEAKRARQRGAA
jgi:predicted HD phosphohydrolase